jgi:hypothetical protein
MLDLDIWIKETKILHVLWGIIKEKEGMER